jgi:tetratricopeptide (TPR) repeat protein
MSKSTVDRFFDATPLCAVVDIPEPVLDYAMAKAFAFYQSGHFAQTEILCKGLLAADHRYWWAYSLYAAVLQKLGRLDEALAQVTKGLRFEPGQPKLIAMRAAILRDRGDAMGGAPRARLGIRPGRPVGTEHHSEAA